MEPLVQYILVGIASLLAWSAIWILKAARIDREIERGYALSKQGKTK